MINKEEILDKLLKENYKLWIVNPERVVFLAMEDYAKLVQEEQIKICARDALLSVEDVEELNDGYKTDRFVTDNEKLSVNKASILNCKRVIE